MAGDFNGDGEPDLAVANTTDGTVSVLLSTSSGPGNASFATKVDLGLGASTAPASIAAGDLDGDGRVDLAIGEIGTGAAAILINNTATNATAPAFAALVNAPARARAQSVALADVDGDGKLDIVVVDSQTGAVVVLINSTALGGQAMFSAGANSPTAAQPGGVATGDLDGDDTPDVAVTNAGAGTVSVFLNTTTTTPSLALRVDYPTASAPRAVAIGDVNGDGKADLVVANGNADTVSVLLAQ